MLQSSKQQDKGTKAVASLPFLAGIIVSLCAIRLTVFAVIIALVLGYRFSIQKYTSESGDYFEINESDEAEDAGEDGAEALLWYGHNKFAKEA